MIYTATGWETYAEMFVVADKITMLPLFLFKFQIKFISQMVFVTFVESGEMMKSEKIKLLKSFQF